MRIFIYILAFSLISSSAICQKTSSLKKQMWEYIDLCHSAILAGEDTDLKPEIIDDCSNGYLEVSGVWPTCGCGCKSIVGAYKKTDGSYFFLNTDTWNCTYKHSISSSEELFSVMPAGFGLNTFLDTSGIDISDKYCVFYLSIDIPRYGTKTKFTLELVPLGLMVESADEICLSIEENQSEHSNVRFMYYLGDIVKSIPDVNSIFAIMGRNDEKLSESEKNAINNIVEGADYDEKFSSLSQDLSYVYYRYKMYERLKYKSVILDWDRNKSRFKIIEMEKAPLKLDFITFIIESEFWQPVC